MTRQIIFAITLGITLSVFAFTATRIIGYFRLTRKGFPVRDIGRRFLEVFKVAIGQTKIFRRPVTGTMHAMVFWGFCVILFGSLEMVADGLAGTEQSLKFLGPVYDLITASGDIFALIITVAIIAFLVRRIFLHIRRFEGIEMKKISHLDANIALTIILLLMISLLGLNTANLSYSGAEGTELQGLYPVSSLLVSLFAGLTLDGIHTWREIFWWTHILLIFIFANLLPYSKHFHVFMSVPNVFLTRLEPLGKLTTMGSITREVKLMMDPNTAFSQPAADAPVERFGVRDAEDASSHWHAPNAGAALPFVLPTSQGKGSLPGRS
jgi:nitrate reductase gamma subunit